MARKTKSRNKRAISQPPAHPAKAASRAGSNAGRGFRYQDAVSAWLAVEIWACLRTPALVVPEGGDDVELRGEETSFVQVKSRREHLGNYTEGEAIGFIEDLWSRSLASTPQPQRLELVVEREIAGLSPRDDHSAVRPIEGPISRRLSQSSRASDFLPITSVVVATSPQEWAIRLIVERLNCAPIAAQMCFAELLIHVGTLADENGRLAQEDYRGLSISDTESLIRHVLAAIDVEAIESALRDGICEAVDFLTPLNDPNFYLGIDVEPGHIAAGLVSERPRSRSDVVSGIEHRRVALVVGPSGAGKSSLMWETASALRHTVRWYRIHRLAETDIPSLRQLIRTFRASEDSPLGFVMDDIGRNGLESWGGLVKEAMSVPGVVLLGSIREEDVTLIAERARAAEIRADPDDELAERLWRELREAGKTSWAGWREPWNWTQGLILEYVHTLTRGRRMQELLADQVAARVSDPTRSLELDILRVSAWAGAANAEIDASRLVHALSASEADLSRALQRLIEEHLVLSRVPGVVTGLHQLRSEALLQLTHKTVLPTLEASFERVAASVSAAHLEPLIADTLSKQRLGVTAVLDSLVIRLEKDPDARALASSLRGLGSGRVSACVDEWLRTSEVGELPRTQVGTAGMLGVTGVDLSGFNCIPEVQAAANRLSRIKGNQEDDPRCLLMERISTSALSALIEMADLASLDEILVGLVGMPLPDAIRVSLTRAPRDLLTADLKLVGSVMGTLNALDREISINWVRQVGQAELFARVQREVAWAGPVTIEDADDATAVHCDLWYVSDSAQENPHDPVVRLCELTLAICPSADIAVSNAITASGELAGFADYPLAAKRIPRENLPASSVPQWNRRWIELIARRVAAPSYSDYLARGAAILSALVPTVEKFFESLFRGKNIHPRVTKGLSSLNAEAKALTPPAISPLEASGAGSGEAHTSVTKFQNLLHSASIELINRFIQLPDQAGAYIAWLSDLIENVDVAISDEPWVLIGNAPYTELTQLKKLLETLRLLAGEAHERQEPPVATWARRGKSALAGNVMHRVYLSAKSAGEKRLDKRKAEFETLAEEFGITAEFHLRVDPKGILPWPPAKALCLLPALGIAEAMLAIDEKGELLRTVLDSSTHLTIIPYVEGVALPALAKSGFQRLLPDAKGAIAWVDGLKIPQAPASSSRLFWEVLGLAGELSAMDQRGLGIEDRPDEEIKVRQSVEAEFALKRNELTCHFGTHDACLQTDISESIENLRRGGVDFAAEAQGAIEGCRSGSGDIEALGLLVLRLIEGEFERFIEAFQNEEASIGDA